MYGREARGCQSQPPSGGNVANACVCMFIHARKRQLANHFRVPKQMSDDDEQEEDCASQHRLYPPGMLSMMMPPCRIYRFVRLVGVGNVGSGCLWSGICSYGDAHAL